MPAEVGNCLAEVAGEKRGEGRQGNRVHKQGKSARACVHAGGLNHAPVPMEPNRVWSVLFMN